MEFSQLQEIMRSNGVAGAGGAGFPSYAKLNKDADTIILNCAECEPLLKLLRSCAANAENNFEMNPEKLYVAKVFVGPGPILKRIMARARGSAARINKRTSHITLVLAEKE